MIDEIEAHLHPQWQRRIVPALLEVMDVLTGEHDSAVQLLVATHSPLVLASMESYFDPERDAIWSLDLVDGVVRLEESAWRRRGDANNWLTSTLFDLQEPRSLEAERAIGSARELLRRKDSATAQDVERVDAELRSALGDVDPFWVRWSAFAEQVRGAP